LKISYIIQAHQYPQQFNRLIRSLTHPSAEFYIHIDKKVDIAPFQDSINSDHVHFIPQRLNVHWAEFSQVEATINLFKALEDNDDQYVVNLSGVDYPIKSNDYILDFFTANNQLIYLEYSYFGPDCADERISRYQRYHFFLPLFNRFPKMRKFIRRSVKVLPIRKLPNNLTAYTGSDWWNLPYKAVRYILNYIDQNQEVVQYFRYTHHSIETFFHTILLNSDLKDQIINDNLRFIDWSGSSSHPNIITSDYYDRLAKSPALFARKFDSLIDSHILDALDQFRSN
jgi:hypothetical protein